MARRRRRVRDLLGHFLTKRAKGGGYCRHACCRGYRQHPKGLPIMLGRHEIRRLSDDELAREFRRHSYDSQAGRAIVRELNRRDRVDRARRRARARREDRRLAAHAQYLAAEEATRGNLLNRAGRRAGVSPQSLFTGSAARARKYASEELLNFWERNPRIGGRL